MSLCIKIVDFAWYVFKQFYLLFSYIEWVSEHEVDRKKEKGKHLYAHIRWNISNGEFGKIDQNEGHLWTMFHIKYL